MPFVSRTQIPQPVVEGIPQSIPAPEPGIDPAVAETAKDVEAKLEASTRATKAKREKIQPTGDYQTGYCRAPVPHRFQKDNPGGPGRRRKDSKSQDDLMRAELLKSQQVTEGGRRRRKTTRELIPGLLMKATLQKQNPKELRILHDEARRLFPERAADPGAMIPIDPVLEREYLRVMLAAVQTGEAAGDGADPLDDFITSVFDANDEEDEVSDAPRHDEEQYISDEEQSDEAA